MLSGKRLVITGVLTDGSIAWHVAKIAQEHGAEIVLTGFGRAIRLTERSAKRLPDPPPVLELDINDPNHMDALVADLEVQAVHRPVVQIRVADELEPGLDRQTQELG